MTCSGSTVAFHVLNFSLLKKLAAHIAAGWGEIRKPFRRAAETGSDLHARPQTSRCTCWRAAWKALAQSKTFLINHYNHLDSMIGCVHVNYLIKIQIVMYRCNYLWGGAMWKTRCTVCKVVRPPICKEVWVSPSANVGDKMWWGDSFSRLS